MTPRQKQLHDPKHSRIVVVMPQVKGHHRLAVPTGSTVCGRAFRTPDNRQIIFTTPNQAIPEGPFHLILEGWGHNPTEKEVLRNAEWRKASKG